jgi:hypothetical protein
VNAEKRKVVFIWRNFARLFMLYKRH